MLKAKVIVIIVAVVVLACGGWFYHTRLKMGDDDKAWKSFTDSPTVNTHDGHAYGPNDF